MLRSTVALAAACLLIAPSAAQGFTLGVGDGTTNTAPSAALGARVYRVVIDPAVPLERYDARIWAYRSAGMDPQLVVGGTGTINHASSRGVVRAAVAAAQRWPYAWSVSVVNEPNESGMGVCEYTRTYIAAYRSLRAIGVRRILYGEWSPNNTLGWQHATLTKCKRSSITVRRYVQRVAWHGYGPAIDFGHELRSMTHRIAGVDPQLYVTEAGYPLHHYGYAGADLGSLRYWRHALNQARRDRFAEIVAWDVHTPGLHSVWDSSLIERSGRPRPAYQLIRETVGSRP